MELDLAGEEEVLDEAEEMAGSSGEAIEFPDDDVADLASATPLLARAGARASRRLAGGTPLRSARCCGRGNMTLSGVSAGRGSG